MSFLTPLYLFGIIAVGLPILLHLVRHQPKNVFQFSTLRFLEHKPPQTNRKNKIEHWLLLLLRAVAVMLLVAAFARPFFKSKDLELAKNSTTQQTILLIDTSSSMRRETLWNAALEKAKNIIQQARKNQIAIYTFDSKLTPVKGLNETKQLKTHQSHKFDQERLTKLTPGWNSTNLGKALTEIAALLQQQAASDPAKTPLQNSTIELITDFQAGSQLNALNNFSWPEELKVRLHQLPVKKTSNAGLQLLALNESSEATVRIVNAADSKQEQFTLTCQGKESTSKQVYVPRGQSRVVQIPTQEDMQHVKQIVLSGDAHDFDNTLYLQPITKTKLNIVHYATPETSATQSPDFFAKRAFPSTKSREVHYLTVGPDSPKILIASTKIHLMILSRPLSQSETSLVKQYLQQGGIVLCSLHNERASQTLKSLLPFPQKIARKLTVAPAEVNGYALLTNINFDHPTFQMFQAPEFSDFTKLKFWKYQRLSLPDSVPHQVLARFDHVHPAILNIPSGEGQLIVMTFGWTPQESQFALSTKFVPMMNVILAQNARLIEVPSQFTVDEKIKLPNIKQLTKIANLNSSPIKLAIGKADLEENIQPGLYEVMVEEENMPAQTFAVNLAIDESKTAPLAVEKLEALGVKLLKPGETTEAESKSFDVRRQVLIQELEQKQKIWRWLIIVALAMLCLETLLAKWIASPTSATRKA
ncbi:BatA domain-containing protein [Gimesia aquarii]|uniref:VWFA domain-containing protein n=1 Tax=Gimesia aquarii TaxID=2527964 RepID=A0A517WVC7_9PLAN|nr:BatA domain-containing protein [Gimesia aquarii]QDU09213.1 hypothetical protein V202x_25850 [Gimesia aquarii]